MKHGIKPLISEELSFSFSFNTKVLNSLANDVSRESFDFSLHFENSSMRKKTGKRNSFIINDRYL